MKSQKRIVVIGGGTGIASLLRGLKKRTEEITAIVTMTDDGGGSGMIRKELGLLPPGDIRNCLVALANTEPTMEKVLQYRFVDGVLDGQNFGNLLIVVLNNIYKTFDVAIKEVSNVLNITGRVLPVTLENVHLVAEFENGDKCIGESRIPVTSTNLGTKIKRMGMFPSIPEAFEECLTAIEQADLIVLGPGSLYTSIIPNLLVNGVSKAIQSSKAKVVSVMNCMTQSGETEDFSVMDHINALEEHSYQGIIDICLCNTTLPRKEVLKKYEEIEGAKPILITEKEINEMREREIEVVLGDFLEDNLSYVRHDADKVSDKIFTLS